MSIQFTIIVLKPVFDAWDKLVKGIAGAPAALAPAFAAFTTLISKLGIDKGVAWAAGLAGMFFHNLADTLILAAPVLADVAGGAIQLLIDQLTVMMRTATAGGIALGDLATGKNPLDDPQYAEAGAGVKAAMLQSSAHAKAALESVNTDLKGFAEGLAGRMTQNYRDFQQQLGGAATPVAAPTADRNGGLTIPRGGTIGSTVDRTVAYNGAGGAGGTILIEQQCPTCMKKTAAQEITNPDNAPALAKALGDYLRS